MRKFYILGLFGLAALIIGLAWAEQITFTTYYPAPYGVYKEFKTTNLTELATTDVASDNAAQVIIGAAVAQTSELKKLIIQDGITHTEGGLIIETRSADPTSGLVKGRMWLLE